MDATYKYMAVVSDSRDSINNIKFRLTTVVGKPYDDFIKKLQTVIREENMDSDWDSYVSSYSVLSDTQDEALELALNILFSDRKTFYKRERFSALIIEIEDGIFRDHWVSDAKAIPHIKINFDYTFGDLCDTYTSKDKDITRSFLKN